MHTNNLTRITLLQGSLGAVIFMNFNLATNSVGFYQISKLACIPITLLLETVLNRRQQILSIKMTTSLLLILFGMGLVAVTEVSFSVKGFLWAAAGVLCSSLAQIFFAPLQKDLNLDALQMLFHLSPILTIGSFATIPIFENTEELLNFKMSKTIIFDVGISCCMAVLLNTSNYLGDYIITTLYLNLTFLKTFYSVFGLILSFIFFRILYSMVIVAYYYIVFNSDMIYNQMFITYSTCHIFTALGYKIVFISHTVCVYTLTTNFNFHFFTVLGWASPLTYQVLGHLKSIIILILGIMFYDVSPSIKAIFGMVLAMVGVIIYTEENRQQNKKKQSSLQKNSFHDIEALIKPTKL